MIPPDVRHHIPDGVYAGQCRYCRKHFDALVFRDTLEIYCPYCNGVNVLPPEEKKKFDKPVPNR
jgi:phage FluMu protein Com